MTVLGQIEVVTLMNLRAIPQRLAASLVVIVSMAAVVAMVISVLAMSAGFLRSVARTGRADRAIVTSAGALTVSASSLPRDAVPIITDAPGVRKDDDGKAIVSADVHTQMNVPKTSDGLLAPVSLHGVGPEAFTLLPQIKLISGRIFKPAVHELIVGRMLPTQFAGLAVGDRVSLPEGDWAIVGSFESDGDQHESELIGDAETVLSAYRRTAFNSVTVMLDAPSAFDGFRNALTADPALKVDVVRETAYFAKLAQPLNSFLVVVAYVVGGIMGLGAVLGALNTMYSAVAARTVEIATLRAIGFGAGPILVSVLAEALLLTVVGAAAGALLAGLFINGHVVLSSYYIYTVAVGPALIALGIAIAAAVGLVGGLAPAIQAARLPVATAIRAN